MEWLGSGTVERVKVDPQNEPSQKGGKLLLTSMCLGRILSHPWTPCRSKYHWPNGFNKYLQLYPKGTLWEVWSEFIPSDAGSTVCITNLYIRMVKN